MSISSSVQSRHSNLRVKRGEASSQSPSRSTTPPMPASPAGPSSPRRTPSTKSPHKSPARSFSLSGKPRTTFTGQIIVPSIPTSELVRPPYDTAPNSTIRRSVSDESIQVRSGRSSSEPPAPPPKQPLLASDSLFQAARLKLSSRDQEAMRKIRSTMNSDSSDTQSHGNPSPLSPLFPNYASGSGSIGRMRPRGTTLSKQVFVMKEEAEAGPSVPKHANQRPKEHADHVIAVLGHAGVGKSTVIRRALRAWGATDPILFQTPQGHPVSSCYSTIPPAGKLKYAWRTEFPEVDIGALSLQGHSPFPESLPNVSGAVICYDATQERSLTGIRDILQRLTTDGMPCVLLACKSDPGAEQAVKPTQGDALAKPFNVGLIEVTSMTPDGKSKMRNALRWLLFKLEQRHRRSQRKSTSPLKTAPLNRVLSPDSDTSSGAEKFMWNQTIRPGTESDTHSSSSSLQWMMKGPLAATLLPLESDDKWDEKSGATDDKAVSEQVEEVVPPTLWFSEAELSNRLFSGIVSAQDENYVTAFLLSYRRFMTPAHLMGLFTDRFRELHHYAISTDIKHRALQRLAGALIDWCKEYPGDLAEVSTQESFRQILDLILPHLFMAHLTAELVEIDRGLIDVRDIDKSWSWEEPDPNDQPVPLSAASDLVLDPEVLYDFESSIDKSENGTLPTTTGASLTPSLRTKSSTSLQVEENYRQRDEMPKSRVNLNGSFGPVEEIGFGKWTSAANYLLNGDPAVFAMELTKAQWSLFKVIRSRDIFRHDFGDEKETPVNKSITFFNHVSRWTSTMILSHPKAKHRARIYDRFMLVTHQLRRLSNYDGLYAIISGMQETSVHRLTQTHSLVQPSASLREFQNHLKLMDPRGGYGAYRRAIQADMAQGKSAIPLLTTILGMVSRLQSTRPEDIRRSDQYIQWDKFERFHEILSIIPQCQRRGLVIAGKVSPGFRRIIDDTPVISSEDALFERSRLLEPIGAQGNRATNAFKRFVNNVDQSIRVVPPGPPPGR